MILFLDVIRRNECQWAMRPGAARGYLAGEEDPGGDPNDGLLTVAGAPAARYVEVRVQYGVRLGPVVGSAFSNAAGEWRVPDLPADDLYAVMAIDHNGVYAPVIRLNRVPYTT